MKSFHHFFCLEFSPLKSIINSTIIVKFTYMFTIYWLQTNQQNKHSTLRPYRLSYAHNNRRVEYIEYNLYYIYESTTAKAKGKVSCVKAFGLRCIVYSRLAREYAVCFFIDILRWPYMYHLDVIWKLLTILLWFVYATCGCVRLLIGSEFFMYTERPLRVRVFSWAYIAYR